MSTSLKVKFAVFTHLDGGELCVWQKIL